MTEKELTSIKERTKSLLELVKEKKALKEVLKDKKTINKEELKSITRRLETIEEILDDICLIASEEKVFERISRSYTDIKSDTNKKLYYVYAYLKKDTTKTITNYIPHQNEYFIFVPSNSENVEYIWYWNIIDRNNKIIRIEEKEDFENKNYIITRKELPFTNKEEYHKSRLYAYHGITDDIFQEGFEKYRANFFRILFNSSTEEEAIEKTYLRYGKKRIHYHQNNN